MVDVVVTIFFCVCRTQADPKVLSQYFIALLRNPKPDDELKKNCVSQLKTFLGEGVNG
jgi:hypothetical protein